MFVLLFWVHLYDLLYVPRTYLLLGRYLIPIMKQNPTTTAIILETRKTLKDGTHPVKLRITFERKQRYITVQDKQGLYVSLTHEDFRKATGRNPRGKYKDYATLFSDFERRANDIISAIKNFTFNDFDSRYKGKKSAYLIQSLKNYARELQDQGRISTAVLMNCTATSIEKFQNKRDIQFENVTVKYLEKYENTMRSNGLSLSTIGMYTRNIRTVYNEAIRAGFINREHYPFGRDGYQPPRGRNVKKALTPAEIATLAKYPLADPRPQFYRDLWLFSFFSNGMNIKDIAQLRNENIDEQTIIFVRAKTERESRKNLENVVVPLTGPLRKIISKWRNKNLDTKQYLFPILNQHMTPLEQYKQVQLVVGYVNDVMKSIATAIGLNKPVTTYVARHSFASLLKRSGAPVEFISESLGHKNVNTTKSYLADFELDTKKLWAEQIVNTVNIDI